jgi:hypothetical protein
MKRIILITVTILLALSASSQQSKRDVIASAGGYNSAGGISISWTLGETIISTYSAGGLTLTTGFQQPKDTIIITAVEENLANEVKITVYPNPTNEIINIRFEVVNDAEISVFILDDQGKLIKTDKIEASVYEKQINVQDLPSGIYYLQLIKGKLVNVYKVVKL